MAPVAAQPGRSARSLWPVAVCGSLNRGLDLVHRPVELGSCLFGLLSSSLGGLSRRLLGLLLRR
jgi:hypothetical protein